VAEQAQQSCAQMRLRANRYRYNSLRLREVTGAWCATSPTKSPKHCHGLRPGAPCQWRNEARWRNEAWMATQARQAVELRKSRSKVDATKLQLQLEGCFSRVEGW